MHATPSVIVTRVEAAVALINQKGHVPDGTQWKAEASELETMRGRRFVLEKSRNWHHNNDIYLCNTVVLSATSAEYGELPLVYTGPETIP